MSEQRVALVTGGGTGLGRAMVEVLAESGVHCGIVGRRIDRLEQTASQLAGPRVPGRIHVIQADVTSTGDRQRAVAECVDHFGRLDVLVNNAGISARAPLLSYTEQDWRKVMETNVEAGFFMAQAAISHMRRVGWGRIINIASVYGSLGLNAQLYPGMFPDSEEEGPVRQPAYHTSKGAVLNMTRELAIAVAPWAITVNAVTPGMFMTEQSSGIISQDVIDSLSRMTPMGRFGEPREVAYAVRFLASEEASFITGAELRVDGGWTIW